jgi:hypothetical protein
MEKPPPCGFAKRGAVPVPLRGLRSIQSPCVFLKSEGGKIFRPLDLPLHDSLQFNQKSEVLS